jgi:hypothetical protein
MVAAETNGVRARGHLRDDRLVSWSIRGSYFESCNCDPICPCRRIDGAAGGRSTHGICTGVLSWIIEEGHADGVDLAGLPVALAIRYDDDEPRSPWSWILYVDSRANEAQLEAVRAIFTGELGGDALKHFPWAWKPSHLLAVRSVPIEVDHTRRRQRLRVRDLVRVTISDVYDDAATVTCVIPGHHRTGEELVASELIVNDALLALDFHGVCGYGSTFDYAG